MLEQRLVRAIAVDRAVSRIPRDISDENAYAAYLKQQIALHGYVVGQADASRTLTPAERQEALQNIELLFTDSPPPELADTMKAGFDQMFFPQDDPFRREVVADVGEGFQTTGSWLSGAGGLLSTVPHPYTQIAGRGAQAIGKGFTIAGTGISVVSTVIPDPHIDDTVQLRALARYSSERFYDLLKEIEQSNPDFAGQVGDRINLSLSPNIEGLRDHLSYMTDEQFTDLVTLVRDDGGTVVDANALAGQVTLGISDYLDKEFGEMVNDVNESVEATRQGDRRRAARNEMDARRRDAEIDGVVYLGGVLVDKVFGNPEVSRKLTGSYQIYKQASNLATNAASLGGVALTAGWVGVGIAAVNLLSGPGSSPEQQTQRMLGQLSEAIDTVYEVMVQSFGQVFRNHELILRKTQEGFRDLSRDVNNLDQSMEARFDGLHSSVSVLRNYVEAQAREEYIDDVLSALGTLRTETRRDTFSMDRVLTALEQCSDHAILRANDPSFVGVQSARWPGQVLSELRDMTRIDHRVGVLPSAMRGLTGRTVEQLPNPLEWARGVQAFIEGYSMLPGALDLTSTRELITEMETMGERIERNLESVLDRANVGTMFSRYNALVDTALGAFERAETQVIEKLPGRGLEQLNQFYFEADRYTVLEPKNLNRIPTEDRHIVVISDRGGFHTFREGYSLLLVDYVDIAQKLGLIELIPTIENGTDPFQYVRTPVPVMGDEIGAYEFIQQVRFDDYTIKFLTGNLEGQEVPHWRRATFVPRRHSTLSQGAEERDIGSAMQVSYLPNSGYKVLGAYPEIENSLNFIGIIAREMVIHPDIRYGTVDGRDVRTTVLEELPTFIEGALDVDKMTELEAVADSIRYVAGVDAMYRGHDLDVATGIAKMPREDPEDLSLHLTQAMLTSQIDQYRERRAAQPAETEPRAIGTSIGTQLRGELATVLGQEAAQFRTQFLPDNPVFYSVPFFSAVRNNLAQFKERLRVQE